MEASVRKLTGITGLIAGLACAGVTLTAHHSHSMFDTSREITISGTVTSYSYRNPYVFLYLDVKGHNKELASWAVEMSKITNMHRRGYKRSMFIVGVIVTERLMPLKDVRLGGK